MRQHIKLTKNWLLLGKALLEFRQITSDFAEKMLNFSAHIFSINWETEYCPKSVTANANSGPYGWIRALLEMGKQHNRDQLQEIKTIALDVVGLLFMIRGDLQIVGYYII